MSVLDRVKEARSERETDRQTVLDRVRVRHVKGERQTDRQTDRCRLS